MKTFKKENVSKTDLENFRDEVQIMSKISHPNILLFMGVCTQGDEVMVITPLMPWDLETLLITKKDTNPLPLYKRLKMMKGAVLGVRWLHESNPIFIHRDLKLSNMLVDDTGNVFVCDFGLTRMKPKGDTNLEYDPLGSPLYMAPEVFIGDFNEKCDVYSFGICLWEALTQTQAFAELCNNLPAFIHAVVDMNQRPEIPADCPESLRSLIEDCWKEKPEDRPSFSQIQERIDVCLVDSAINDEGGRKMWYHRSLIKLEELPWPEFAKNIGKTLNIPPLLDSPAFRCLKALTVGPSTLKLDQREVVTLQKFGAFLDWFGPLLPDKHGKHVLDRVTEMLKYAWFHGDLTVEQTSQKLAGSPAGTFLVRFSGQAGCYTVSYVHSSRPCVHQRLQYFPHKGTYMVQNVPGEEFSSMNKLLRAKKESWGISSPCPGSKYPAIFLEQQESGVGMYLTQTDSEPLPPVVAASSSSSRKSSSSKSSSRSSKSSKSGKKSSSSKSSSKSSSSKSSSSRKSSRSSEKS